MIYDTYSELITEQILKEILLEGENPSASEIAERFEDFVEDNDISQPLFISKNYHVFAGDTSSASSYNGLNSDIERDLKVLYKHLFKISDQSISNFERWRNESKRLEGRLTALEERMSSLLLLSADTAGYFNFMQDNFTDNSKVDLTNTTAYVNVDKGVVSIGTSNTGVTRIDLDDLEDTDIEFNILSKNNLISSVSTQGSHTKYVVSDITNYWQEKVYTNKPAPVSVEIKVDLQEEQSISRIDIDLHMANQNSSAQVTPLYSTDNYNWAQLPTTNPTRLVADKSTFQFSSVSARWVKFIMTKPGFDQVHNGLYSYEFGVDEISFYSEGFATNVSNTLISQALSVNDIDGDPEQFSKVVLEVCEDVPEDTSIDYYVSAFNDPDEAIGNFTSIDPLNRSGSTKPTVLDFGELEEVTVSGITISYDTSSSDTLFVNPEQSFTLIDSISGAAAVTVSGLASSARYSFSNSNERILDHQLDQDIQIAQGTLEVWRNVSIKGSDTLVRDYVNGWGFSEPYYSTTVSVENAQGHEIDFGGKTVIVDGAATSGKVTLTKGNHIVSVHKDNWRTVSLSGVTDLASLKTADKLYPYNQRYLVEGLNYPSVWPTTEAKVYLGCDVVAEHLMKKVSIFDLINNISSDDYSRFALDLDVEDTGRLLSGVAASNTDPTSVFVVKVDEANPDFINEQYMIRFKSANSLFKYLRFKAVLQTEDTNITPFLDSYRIKIAS